MCTTVLKLIMKFRQKNFCAHIFTLYIQLSIWIHTQHTNRIFIGRFEMYKLKDILKIQLDTFKTISIVLVRILVVPCQFFFFITLVDHARFLFCCSQGRHLLKFVLSLSSFITLWEFCPELPGKAWPIPGLLSSGYTLSKQALSNLRGEGRWGWA